ncbi:hypothetical protein QYF61_019428 [Mycteria americana]|uniref:Keratin n=1 Tax=Mycteria americana TaxID=33587 RepID=A0AAN7N3V1_MYCAM|nr:hypothetical protein QYF61_019428 [Mycteria americana]
MSCYDLCRPCGPTPLANSCNEPCVRQCQDSRVVIQPSPVVVTLPGPILSSFPQNTAVGSTTSAAVGSILSEEGVPISSGGFSLSGLGGRYYGRSPTPLANSCNEPCIRQCQDSTVVIQPSPVVVTLPGPILSSFPQNTTVGSSASAAVGSALSAEGVPISSGSSLGFGSFGYPGLRSGYSRPYRRYSTYRSGFYGPC